MSVGLAVNVVFFMGMGLLALVRPAGLGQIVEIDPATVLGRNEFRAVYGGFGVVMALALLWSIQDTVLGPGIQATVALALLGMAAGRLIGVLVERFTTKAVLFGACEAALALALWYL